MRRPPGSSHPRLRPLPSRRNRLKPASQGRVPFRRVRFGLQQRPDGIHHGSPSRPVSRQLRASPLDVPPSPPFDRHHHLLLNRRRRVNTQVEVEAIIGTKRHAVDDGPVEPGTRGNEGRARHVHRIPHISSPGQFPLSMRRERLQALPRESHFPYGLGPLSDRHHVRIKSGVRSTLRLTISNHKP